MYDDFMATAVIADIDPLALERQVCFALAITNRAVLAVYRPLLEPLGLTHPQYLVMLTLWDNTKTDAEPLSVKDIAALLQVDSATLSPMLKRLQAQGLITRARSATERHHIWMLNRHPGSRVTARSRAAGIFPRQTPGANPSGRSRLQKSRSWRHVWSAPGPPPPCSHVNGNGTRVPSPHAR